MERLASSNKEVQESKFLKKQDSKSVKINA